MAECYRTVSGDFDELLEYLTEGIMQAYMSSSLEASRDFEAVGSGGSRGMLFKINTWSESGFVDTLRMLINEYELD